MSHESWLMFNYCLACQQRGTTMNTHNDWEKKLKKTITKENWNMAPRDEGRLRHGGQWPLLLLLFFIKILLYT